MKPDGDVDRTGFFSPITGLNPQPLLPNRCSGLGDALLDLAVTHELGHAICQDQDERRADDYGRGLREKKPVACGKGPGIGAARASRASR